MKKVLVALVTMFLFGGYSFAEDMKSGDMPMKNDAGMMKKEHTKKDCVMMKDGKMMVMKGRKKMMMNTNMTMSNGTMVMKDGTVMAKDGIQMMMKEGDRMDMNGNMMKHQKTTKKKTM